MYTDVLAVLIVCQKFTKKDIVLRAWDDTSTQIIKTHRSLRCIASIHWYLAMNKVTLFTYTSWFNDKNWWNNSFRYTFTDTLNFDFFFTPNVTVSLNFLARSPKKLLILFHILVEFLSIVFSIIFLTLFQSFF